MSVAILFFLVPIGAIVAWWLSQQRLMAKPWLEVGAIGEGPRPRGVVLAFSLLTPWVGDFAVICRGLLT